eukprot:TRINITY_DN65671_c0_g1_i1.p1 TRINITY_DN65671_c0_g1~~TRINITY_DN65671_c0_g1_i1.p1  ORF type:complete len:226 (-),score=49.82 TRINITY_DN65671_c0_g1_i1:97-744(-)
MAVAVSTTAASTGTFAAAGIYSGADSQGLDPEESLPGLSVGTVIFAVAVGVAFLCAWYQIKARSKLQDSNKVSPDDQADATVQQKAGSLEVEMSSGDDPAGRATKSRQKRLSRSKSMPPPGRRVDTAEMQPSLVRVGSQQALARAKTGSFAAEQGKAEVWAQLIASSGEELDLRRKSFKLLCAKWHPDKHAADNVEIATDVFKYLQEQKTWYMEG